LQQGTQAIANDAVVVGQEDANAHPFILRSLFMFG
jgi:hypothetical protein